jgi:hypothetical protein
MIIDYLKAHNHYGKQNAVKQSILKDELGISKRQIRAEIESYNSNPNNEHIVSFCNEGIFIVSSRQEFRTLRARAKRAVERNVNIMKRCDIMLATTGQLQIEDLWDEDEREISINYART